jgi:hypothetical protein
MRVPNDWRRWSVLAVLMLLPLQAPYAQGEPCLGVGPDSLQFFYNACEDPADWAGLDTQSVVVYNCGDGQLEWTMTASEPWVIFEPASGGNFDSVMVYLEPSLIPQDSIAPGDSVAYNAYIEVDAGNAQNSPRYVGVRLWKYCSETGFVLRTDPEQYSLDLQAGEDYTGQFFVYEEHGESVMFTTSNSSSWLTLPETFVPWTTPVYVPFSVTTDGLAEGVYSDSIIIDSEGPSNTPLAIPVTLSVGSGGVNIVALPDHFEFWLDEGGSVSRAGFLVYEESGSELYFWVDQANWSPWIDIEYPDSQYPGWLTPDSVHFNIDAAGLSPGTYGDTLIIYNPLDDSTWYDEVYVPVIVHIDSTGGDLQLTSYPRDFSFTVNQGDSVTGVPLEISEIHGDSLEFWVYNSQYWLYVDTMQSQPMITPQTVYLSVYTASLEPGLYVDSVMVMSYQTPAFAVPVLLVVESADTVTTVQSSPAYLSLSVQEGAAVADSIFISEAHGYNVGFQFSNTEEWLTVDPLGMPPYVTPMSLVVGATAESLTAGMYTDSIIIEPTVPGEFNPFAVPVYLYVYPEGPSIVVVPDSFNISAQQGDYLQDINFVVYEEHGDSVAFAVDKLYDSEWLVLHDPPWGYHITPDSVFFDVIVGDMDPGIYLETLVIEGPPADCTMTLSTWELEVNLALTVMGGGYMYDVDTDPHQFDFALSSGDSGFDSLTVFEANGETHEFYYYNSSSWLVVNPYGMPPFTMPLTMPIAVTTDSLPPGEYQDTIFIASVLEWPPWEDIAVPVNLVVYEDYLCGDVNTSGNVDIDDVVYCINYVFLVGAEPIPVESGDVDCNGFVDVDDIVFLISYIFTNGPRPCEDCT